VLSLRVWRLFAVLQTGFIVLPKRKEEHAIAAALEMEGEMQVLNDRRIGARLERGADRIAIESGSVGAS